MRKVIMKSAAVSAAIAISAAFGITASAAPAETTKAERTSDITSVSITEEVSDTDTTLPPSEGEITLEAETTAEDSEVSAETTAATTVVTTTTTEWHDSPYADGMLSDEDLYNYVLNYIDDDATLDTQGSGVLIGEDIINREENAEYVSETENNEEKFTSGEKVMYSIATRDGSIFYIIIDKGANGENVYFLNSVDIVDLASLINTEDENLSAQEKEILNEANAVTGSYDISEETPEDDDGANSSKNNSSNNSSSSNSSAPAPKSNNTLYIVLGVGAVIAIGVGWYFKVGPGKKKNVGFDEDEDEESEEEEYYEEDTDEDEEAPAEESYEEE